MTVPPSAVRLLWAVALLACAVAAGARATESDSSPPPPLAATPAPQALSQPPATTLPQPVTRVLRALSIPTDNLSIFVQAVDADAPVVTLHPTVPRNPASAMKLVTTYAALDKLGPAYTWYTDVYLQGTRTGDVMKGDLVLRGGGDPWLTTQRFWQLLRELRARGLRHIEGDLVIDDSFFSIVPEDPAAFDGQPFRTYNVGPSALLVNFQAARFLFMPEPATGTVTVDVDPPLANLAIDNRLQLVPGPCDGYQRGVAFHMPYGLASGRVVLSGQFPRGCAEFELWRTVLEPHSFAFGVFKSLWTELGGTISGSVRKGVAIRDERFFRAPSIPLAEAIRSVNKFSNNPMTRILMLTVGGEASGYPGTVEKGRAAIGAWLGAKGIATTGLHVANGAGLARDARVTAELLGRMLLDAWQSPYQAEFISSLPVSGIDGTLRSRLDGRARGRMHLKTGRLENVAAIGGYVYAASGRHFVVVAIDNAPDADRGPGREWLDALLEWVYAQ